jgi:hypothetical protein
MRIEIRIARRRAEQAGAPLSWTSEGADMLFVGERTRKAAATERQPQRAGASNVQRNEGTRFSSPE